MATKKTATSKATVNDGSHIIYVNGAYKGTETRTESVYDALTDTWDDVDVDVSVFYIDITVKSFDDMARDNLVPTTRGQAIGTMGTLLKNTWINGETINPLFYVRY